jgi:hypothetical protein
MLKNILKLDGAQKLTKNEQKSIKGEGVYPPPGSSRCSPRSEFVNCPVGYNCVDGSCIRSNNIPAL